MLRAEPGDGSGAMKNTQLLWFLSMVVMSNLAEGAVVDVEAGKKDLPEQTPSSPSEPSKEKEDLFKLGGRVHTRWEMSHFKGEELTNDFSVQRVYVKAIWNPTASVIGVVQIGIEEDFITSSAASLIKDAYLHVSLFEFFELRAGQFKKPFSGLELQSSASLKVPERGIGNELIERELLYGARDIGAQVSGRIIKSVKLDYAVGIFNGSGQSVEDLDRSKDIVGRISMRPRKRLRLGASGSFKFFDGTNAEVSHAFAAGLDARWRLSDFVFYAEGQVAEDHLFWIWNEELPRPPLLLNGLAILSYRYRFPVAGRLRAEPVFKFEILDLNADAGDDLVFTYGPGINIYAGKYIRFMVHGEFRRAQQRSALRYRDRELLMVQLCFDI